MKNNIKRIFALSLALSIGLGTFTYAEDMPSYCDEAFYITADYYGKLKESSIVKGYYVNGASKITDYGKYDEVINMTNTVKPEIKDGSLTFNFAEDIPNRFYFEGKTKEPVKNVPWNISVSYKLNGVPKSADTLAGAKGLVEINLDIVPNKAADEYYRNNFLLTAATVVNSDDILSLEAEGAQVQSAGNMKAVVFAAIPGEEQHFQLRIGTEDFSFAGWTFVMMPATVEQLKKINDLRELKEKTEDSAEAVSDSLDIILDTMDSLSSSCTDLSGGLATLNEARRIISDGKGNVYSSADNSLEQLKNLTEGLKPYDSHLEKGSQTLDNLNEQLNSVYDNILKISSNLEELEACLADISADLASLKNYLEENDKAEDDYQECIRKLKRNLERLKKNVSDSSMYLYNLHGALDDLERFAEKINMPRLTGNLDKYIEMLYESGDMGSAVILSTLSQLQDYLNSMSDMVDIMSTRVASVLGKSSDLCESLSKAADNSNSLIDALTQLSSLMDNSIDDYKEHKDEILNFIESTQKAVDTAKSSSEICRNIISTGNESRNTINENHPQLIQSIEDSRNLLNTAIEGTESLHTFCTDLENLAQKSGNKLDEGTAQSIAALTDALAKTANGLGQTGVIKNAKDTVKDLIDDEWDENTGEDSNILLTDAEAEKLSFTSGKNPEPKSLQILMRTEEITADDDSEAVDVDEDFHPQGNIFTRIISIFKKIFDTIAGIFK